MLRPIDVVRMTFTNFWREQFWINPQRLRGTRCTRRSPIRREVLARRDRALVDSQRSTPLSTLALWAGGDWFVGAGWFFGSNNF
jgi:hypothetical protein